MKFELAKDDTGIIVSTFGDLPLFKTHKYEEAVRHWVREIVYNR